LLVQYDTCNWARRNNILVGCGRGSAAGSLLLYLLGITLIDPIKYDLIFERFLLPERAGLYPADTTIIGEDIESSAYVEITLENGQVLKIDKDAQLEVMRDGSDESIAVYADELKEGDDILFDNHDLLFTLPTL
jgi:DNA polymerase-3 subunit alpha